MEVCVKWLLFAIILTHIVYVFSTISSGINSLATVVLHDFIKPFSKKLSERKSVIIYKILNIYFGLQTFAFTFLAQEMGDLIWVSNYTLF